MSPPSAQPQGATDPEARLAGLRSALSEGRWAEVLQAGAVLRAERLAAGDSAMAAEASLMVAKALFNADRLEEAEVWCRQALDLDVPFEAAPVVAAVWVVRAAVLARLENTPGALESIRRALAVMPQEAAATTRRSVYYGVAITYRALGLWHSSIPVWAAAVEADLLLDPAGSGLVMSRINLVDALMRAHDDLSHADERGAQVLLDEAAGMVDALRAQLAQAHTPWLRCFLRHALGIVLLRSGGGEEACALLQQGLDEAGAAPVVARGAMHLDLARAAQRLGRTQLQLMHARLATQDLEADRPAPSGLVPLPSLHDLRHAYALLGEPAKALQLQDIVHARIQRNVLALLDAQTEGLPARLSVQTVMLQNADLREAKAGLERQFRQVSREAAIDDLTGLLNRRALKSAYDELCVRPEPVVLALLDLDDFKSVNDGFSHATGDAVLREVASLITEGLRAPDTVGRYGGEEFVLLLAGLQLDAAWTVVDRLRQRVQAHDWTRLAPGLRLTFSAGVVATQEGESLEAAAGRADFLLYGAKHEGRNRVVAAAVSPGS